MLGRASLGRSQPHLRMISFRALCAKLAVVGVKEPRPAAVAYKKLLGQLYHIRTADAHAEQDGQEFGVAECGRPNVTQPRVGLFGEREARGYASAAALVFRGNRWSA